MTDESGFCDYAAAASMKTGIDAFLAKLYFFLTLCAE
jgi:hypothetical protein